ncbi:MAG: thiamine ABC transporter substrate-binding protein [Acidimicrobiales bacterium]
MLAAACGSSGSTGSAGTGDTAPATTVADAPGSLRVMTHDSFAVSDSVLQAFEDRTGIKVELISQGDAVEVVNQAILTKDNPQADVLFGIDSNTLTKAYDADLFEPYQSPGLDTVDAAFQLDPEHRVTPIDHGDVCLNYDKAWFAGKGIAPPTSIDDLTDPRYKGTLVVENPATSTPGLAFMLATVAKYGADGWTDYWQKLRANGVSVVDGWEAAYYTSFSGSSGKGDKPIVVSYATSPPAEVIDADPQPADAPTAVIDDSCFRQVEFAGVLSGTKRPAAAQAFIDFLLSNEFQDDVPEKMYVLPVSSTATVSDTFAKYSADPSDPLSLPSDEIGANSSDWVDSWTRTVLG